MTWSLIEPPSDSDPTREWKKFLQDMLEMPPDDGAAQWAIRVARRELAERDGASTTLTVTAWVAVLPATSVARR